MTHFCWLECFAVSGVSPYETYVDGSRQAPFFCAERFGRLRSCWNGQPRFPWLPIVSEGAAQVFTRVNVVFKGFSVVLLQSCRIPPRSAFSAAASSAPSPQVAF